MIKIIIIILTLIRSLNTFNVSCTEQSYDSITLDFDYNFNIYNSYMLVINNKNSEGIFIDIDNEYTLENLEDGSTYNIELYGVKNGSTKLDEIQITTLKLYKNIENAVVSNDLSVYYDGCLLTKDKDYLIDVVTDTKTTKLDTWTTEYVYDKTIKLTGLGDFEGSSTTKRISDSEIRSNIYCVRQPQAYACFPTGLSMLLNTQYSMNISPRRIIEFCNKNLSVEGLYYNEEINLINNIGNTYNITPNYMYHYDLKTFNGMSKVNNTYTNPYTYNGEYAAYYRNSTYNDEVNLDGNQVSEEIINKIDNLLNDKKPVLVRGQANGDRVYQAHVMVCYYKSGNLYKLGDPETGKIYLYTRDQLKTFMTYHKGIFWFD